MRSAPAVACSTSNTCSSRPAAASGSFVMLPTYAARNWSVVGKTSSMVSPACDAELLRLFGADDDLVDPSGIRPPPFHHQPAVDRASPRPISARHGSQLAERHFSARRCRRAHEHDVASGGPGHLGQGHDGVGIDAGPEEAVAGLDPHVAGGGALQEAVVRGLGAAGSRGDRHRGATGDANDDRQQDQRDGSPSQLRTESCPNGSHGTHRPIANGNGKEGTTRRRGVPPRRRRRWPNHWASDQPKVA